MNKTFKSAAHQAKLAQLVKDGKIKQADYNQMHYATASRAKPLPKRISAPKRPKP